MKVVALTILILCVQVSCVISSKCFQAQYAMDNLFAKGAVFQNVSDVVVNVKDQHVLVLQRSYPPVSVWRTNGSFLFAWKTQEIGYPHSLILDQTGSVTTVWITDMAGELAAGKVYGHCIKHFNYTGEYIKSIGTCGANSSGSGLHPVQFDRVTDLAINSKGFLYILDGDVGGKNNHVLVFDPLYKLIDVWNMANKAGSGELEFNLPHSVAIDLCDRLWITDTLNNRIQIVSSAGKFLKQWKCFNDSLPYGIDIDTNAGTVVITVKNDKQQAELLVFALPSSDCLTLPDCLVFRRVVIKSDETPFFGSNTMLHSVSIDSSTGSLYVSMLPGSIPPLKFSPVPLPPSSNINACPKNPTQLPKVWNATVLLTPFHADELRTAYLEFSDDKHAMLIKIYDLNSDLLQNFFIVKNKTYTLSWNVSTLTCSEEKNAGWTTPGRDWLGLYDKCECIGEQSPSQVSVVTWSCSKDKLRDLYWVHVENGSIWRIFLNNKTNPTRLPVIGNYTMAHFTDYGSEITYLDRAYELCTGKRNVLTKKIIEPHSLVYQCPSVFSFPNWPIFFHATAMIIPVVLNDALPFPAQVLYDWQKESQRTIMCESSKTYNAYLVRNETFTAYVNFQNNSVDCISRFPFGPPHPNWMTLDKCKCKGIIKDNSALSSFTNTVIAVCPIAEDRVFWTWFVQSPVFTPVIFFETETPPEEGTGLALVDYYDIYQGTVLLDMEEIGIPPQCVKN